MGDSSEELEPLFDYSRVQHSNFVDLEEDSDSSSSSPKRRKISNNNKEENNNGRGKSVQEIDNEEEEDKENWLPPPPSNLAHSSKLHEDSTIKELRLKRLELASVVQSTKHLLQAAEEAEMKTFTSSSHTITEESTEEVPKSAADRTKIVLSIQDKAETKQYRIFADERFEQLFRKYAQKANIDVNNLVFSFDGDKINPASTPQTLGMEDDDLVEVHVKAS